MAYLVLKYNRAIFEEGTRVKIYLWRQHQEVLQVIVSSHYLIVLGSVSIYNNNNE